MREFYASGFPARNMQNVPKCDLSYCKTALVHWYKKLLDHFQERQMMEHFVSLCLVPCLTYPSMVSSVNIVCSVAKNRDFLICQSYAFNLCKTIKVR